MEDQKINNIILALDTSVICSSICLSLNKKIIANYIQNSNYHHSETLLPIINNILNLNKINVNNINTFILTNGPGSFTGIRVGISTVYGLSISQKSKIIGVSTLYAMIKQYDDIIYKGYFLISIIKANNTKIFNSIYFKNQNGNLDVIYNDRIAELNDVINEFYNKPCIILGYSYDFPKDFFQNFFQNFYFYNLDNTSNAYSLIKIIKENTNLINNKINNTLVEANYLMKFLS